MRLPIRYLLVFLLIGFLAITSCKGLFGGVDAYSSSPYSWVQVTADGETQLRSLTNLDECPTAIIDGTPQKMQLRVAPSSSVEDQQFPVRSCQLNLPSSVGTISLDGVSYKPLARYPQKIALIGDTGCRIGDQACNAKDAWPFEKIAKTIAALKPDLIIHVGDYLYREKPCPEGNKGCEGAASGYGWQGWEADFFSPANELLKAAPWVMVRGNHEACNRAGRGWQRFLNPYDFIQDEYCQFLRFNQVGDYSDPYVIPLSKESQLLVFDTAGVQDIVQLVEPTELRTHKYAQLLNKATTLANKTGVQTIWAHHHHTLAYTPPHDIGSPGMQWLQNRSYPSTYYPSGVVLSLNGHVHGFQALTFSSDHPATWVVGNSGTNLDGAVDTPPAARLVPAPYTTLARNYAYAKYGFSLMEQVDDAWLLSSYDVTGQAMLRCNLRKRQLVCDR